MTPLPLSAPDGRIIAFACRRCEEPYRESDVARACCAKGGRVCWCCGDIECECQCEHGTEAADD